MGVVSFTTTDKIQNVETDVVHIEVRLRFHPHNWEEGMPIPTFSSSDSSVVNLKENIHDLLLDYETIENKDILLNSMISSITIPAIADTVFSKEKNCTRKENQQFEQMFTDNHLDNNEEEGDDTALDSKDRQIDMTDLGNSFFSVDRIRIRIDDSSYSSDHDNSIASSSAIPRIFAVFRIHIYHPRPSTWIPAISKSIHHYAAMHPIPNDVEEGTWDALQDENSIKSTVLRHIILRNSLSKLELNNIMSMNGTVLLHGKPGTGKSTLCRTIANQAAIRLNTCGRGIFLHVHMHRLTNPYFGQSAKNVASLFQIVQFLTRKYSTFIVILFDEVESIAMSRSFSSRDVGGDAVRAVNALLTGLDKLMTYSNVIVLSTSNLYTVVDDAFLDRMDIVLEVKLPGVDTTRRIIQQCMLQLGEKGVIKMHQMNLDTPSKLNLSEGNNEILKKICSLLDGMSPRRICKLMISACCMAGGSDAFPLLLDCVIDKMAVASEQWHVIEKNRKEKQAV